MVTMHYTPLFIAYIDPGSGALALQVLIVSALAMVARLSGLFRWRRKGKDEAVPPHDGQDQ